MGGMGASGGANQALFDSFLSNGQFQLYMLQDWRHLIKYSTTNLGVSQNQIDYPADAARSMRILGIDTPYGGVWRDLFEGITTDMWSTMETLSYPCRYERYEQVLIYPKADQIYQIRFRYVADLDRFTENDDRATIDDEMILLHAVTMAKLHYRQPDAEAYKGQLDALVARLRGNSFSRNGVYRRSEPPAAERKPLVVGRDVP
jgi:hypothetical protein